MMAFSIEMRLVSECSNYPLTNKPHYETHRPQAHIRALWLVYIESIVMLKHFPLQVPLNQVPYDPEAIPHHILSSPRSPPLSHPRPTPLYPSLTNCCYP